MAEKRCLGALKNPVILRVNKTLNPLKIRLRAKQT